MLRINKIIFRENMFTNKHNEGQLMFKFNTSLLNKYTQKKIKTLREFYVRTYIHI